jgi:hypothetical protein
MVFGLRVVEIPKVQEFYDMKDDMNRHERGDPLEWETVAGGSTPLLQYPDTAFDLRDMLVAAGQVEPGATGQGLDEGFEG